MIEAARGELAAPRPPAFYLKAAGLKPWLPWCGSFVTWCHQQGPVSVPGGPGMARSWFPASATTYYRRGAGGSLDASQAGDVVGFWNGSRVSHVALVDEPLENVIITIEGNVGGGPGYVKRLRRARGGIYAAASWLPAEVAALQMPAAAPQVAAPARSKSPALPVRVRVLALPLPSSGRWWLLGILLGALTTTISLVTRMEEET